MARGKHSFSLLTACWETNSSVRSGEQVGKGEGKDLRKARMNQGERFMVRAQRVNRKGCCGWTHQQRSPKFLGGWLDWSHVGLGCGLIAAAPWQGPLGKCEQTVCALPVSWQSLTLTSTTALSPPCAWPGCRIKVTERLHASMLPGWKFPKGAPESPTSSYFEVWTQSFSQRVS